MLLSELVDKIKRLRFEKGLTLDGLAQKSGLSKGYLSKIENQLSIPTVTTLQKLASAFEIDFTYFFSGEETAGQNNALVFLRREQRSQALTELPHRGGDEPGQADSGTLKRWALATRKKGRNMDPYIIELGHQNEEIYQHQGEGFIYILEGEIEFGYGGESYTFSRGDTLYMDCDIPYSAKSISPKPAQLLMVMFHYKRMETDDIRQLVVRNE